MILPHNSLFHISLFHTTTAAAENMRLSKEVERLCELVDRNELRSLQVRVLVTGYTLAATLKVEPQGNNVLWHHAVPGI
jgi:hypothetical protein